MQLGKRKRRKIPNEAIAKAIWLTCFINMAIHSVSWIIALTSASTIFVFHLCVRLGIHLLKRNKINSVYAL